MTAPTGDPTSRTLALARAGLWLLPVYGVLLTLSTLTHQPDPETDFAGYSRYVTTDLFLASHLGASILGAGLGLVGLVAALLLLVRGPAAVPALVATALTIVANTLLTAVFAAAAFAQPAIGRAFLAGDETARDIDADVYGHAAVQHRRGRPAAVRRRCRGLRARARPDVAGAPLAGLRLRDGTGRVRAARDPRPGPPAPRRCGRRGLGRPGRRTAAAGESGAQPWGWAMLTIHEIPNRSSQAPNSSPHICRSSGTDTLPPAESFSQ